MKKIIMIFIILLVGLVGSGVFAYTPDPWTTQDTILQSAFTGITLIDIWQTYNFLYTSQHTYQYTTEQEYTNIKTGNKENRTQTHTGQYYETNFFLGENPSKFKFFTLTSLALLSHLFISYILPYPFRTIWQIAWSCIEIKYVYHNYQMGIRIGIASF
jgi:hypothetical protein